MFPSLLSCSKKATGDGHRTAADRTRKIYDRLSLIYPISSFFLHSVAHREALAVSGIADGMRVLEVATGSGEMFRRLVRANPSGCSVGLDLSPNMAARTQRLVRNQSPQARTQCEAVDARHLPFRDSSFDAVVCCYLLELLSGDDIAEAIGGMHRVLRHGGAFTLIVIGQQSEFVNRLYRVGGRLAPAFWGRQVDDRIAGILEAVDFRITGDRIVRQMCYPSRVLIARK